MINWQSGLLLCWTWTQLAPKCISVTTPKVPLPFHYPTDTGHFNLPQKITTVKSNLQPHSIQFSKSRESWHCHTTPEFLRRTTIILFFWCRNSPSLKGRWFLAIQNAREFMTPLWGWRHSVSLQQTSSLKPFQRVSGSQLETASRWEQ